MPLLEHQLPPVAACQRHFRKRESVTWRGRKIHPPIVVNASVSSGKSIMIAELAAAVRDAALQRERPQEVCVLVLQRQGELCDQNSAAAWDVGLENSVYSASCGKKSVHFRVVYATEGTLARAIEDHRFSKYTEDELALLPEKRARMKKFHPDLILVDEAHQVPYDQPDSQYMRILTHFYDCKPHMRMAGFTGSPFRDIAPIIGDTDDHLWREIASIKPGDEGYPEGGVGDGIISTEFMIDQGWVVPPVFGYPDSAEKSYDFSHLSPNGWEYDEAELDAAVSDRDTLLAICQDVIEKASSRKGVLIFAATQRHARQIAAALKLLGEPEESIGVITERTSAKDRKRILDGAKVGTVKYTVNVAVLTTGVNVPWWDTLVFMRPIGSLVLLIQAIGRVLRLLIQDGEPSMIERSGLHGMNAADRLALIAASSKPDALVLDYAGVMETLGHLYENPVLEQAELEKAKKDHLELIECPVCATMNSPHARRCIGRDSAGVRCEHFWHFRECPSCRTKNDQVARECRNSECRRMLIDPNAALTGKHYVKGEYIPVTGMQVRAGNGGKIVISFQLSDGRDPVFIYYPQAGNQKRLNTRIWRGFVAKLPISDFDKKRLGGMKADSIMQNLHLIPRPESLCARLNGDRWNLGPMVFAEQVQAPQMEVVGA